MTETSNFFTNEMADIYEEYLQALEKHPRFPTEGKHPMTIVVEELGEMSQAYNDGDYAHAVKEGRHTIVTLLRWIKRLEQANAMN